MKTKQLSVRLNGEHVGILEQTITGRMIFTYDSSASRAISISMPIRGKPYDELQTEAYFAGLLPENNLVKKIIGKNFNVSPSNSFALLKAIGYDCAGAISCHEMAEPVVAQQQISMTAEIISAEKLYRHILELPKKPLFLGVDGLRLSLAGVQDKAAICLIDNQVALATNGCPTTHILKPSSHYFPGMAENEYFCLRLAKRLGLVVPDVQLRQIKDITFLLIERYDRHIQNGYVERIHQEDFCQALSILSSQKYQNEGGPSFKNCFDLLKETTQPALNRNKLAAALAFNYLIGNLDAHGKNYSLLHQSPTQISMAPLYDIVCTQAYPKLTKKMAMKIGKKYVADDVRVSDWELLCQEIGYRYLSMKNTILQQAELITKIALEEKQMLSSTNKNHEIIDVIMSVVDKNSNRIQTWFR